MIVGSTRNAKFNNGASTTPAPNDLKRATDEIMRISNKYILCIEYFSDKLTEMKYQGKNKLLFKMEWRPGCRKIKK